MNAVTQAVPLVDTEKEVNHQVGAYATQIAKIQ